MVRIKRYELKTEIFILCECVILLFSFVHYILSSVIITNVISILLLDYNLFFKLNKDFRTKTQIQHEFQLLTH